MYIGQSGDGDSPSSSNGDGIIYLAQDNVFVIYTNVTQLAVFNNTGITFNKPLTVPSIILKPSSAPANDNFIG